MSEAGATSIQELAFTFTNAIAYIDDLISHGSTIDEIAPRLSFFFSAKLNIIEEVAKFRAAREVYARLIQERYSPKNDFSTRLRFHVQTSGAELSPEKPELNLIRVSIQALGAIFGGAQSLHTNSFDEALSLPTEFSASIAVDTQSILQRETDLLTYVDPFEGSIAVESLTDQIISGTQELIDQINSLGGALKAIKTGFQKNEISSEALKIALAFEAGDKIRVGFKSKSEREKYYASKLFQKTDQVGIIHKIENNESKILGDLLDAIEQISVVELENGDLMKLIEDALKSDVSLGEIVQALKNLEVRTFK
jgi:methylmalonyl-CoA mutase N-terminal domain/subunit